MLSIIQAAGWPIWPLVACSILALALVIERFISLKTAKVAPPQLLDEVLAVSRSRRARRPTSSTSWSRTPRSARCWPAASARSTPTRAAPKRPAPTMESTGRAVAHRLERYLSALATIASAAPLLGLLGTVIGMIEIFGSQRAGGARAATRRNWRTASRSRSTTRPSA